MKLFLELDVKPFRSKSYRGYSGIYTQKGRKNQRAKMEISSEEVQLDRIDSYFHEWGHLVCDIETGDAHKTSKHAADLEDAFCLAIGTAGRELFRRMLNGKPLTGKIRLTLDVDPDQVNGKGVA